MLQAILQNMESFEIQNLRNCSKMFKKFLEIFEKGYEVFEKCQKNSENHLSKLKKILKNFWEIGVLTGNTIKFSDQWKYNSYLMKVTSTTRGIFHLFFSNCRVSMEMISNTVKGEMISLCCEQI